MSLLRTLATVAVGVAVAQGARGMMERRRSGTASGGGSGGGLLDALQDARRGGGSASGGAGDLGGLGSLLGGSGAAGGGLGGILDSLGGGQDARGGGLGGLGALLGGGAAGGALGGLLAGGRGDASAKPDFGNRLNEAFTHGGPKTPPTPAEEAMAGLMIRAMIMAAKSDGRIDDRERQMLLDNLKGADAEERAFVEAELRAPVDVAGFVRDVPNDPGLKRQIYATALMAIDLDSEAEARFMHDLARGLGMAQSDLDAIHGKMGAGSLWG